MKHIADSIIPALKTWAAQQPTIERVHLFGSRVRGVTKEGSRVRADSDLDIAIELSSAVENTIQAWIDHADQWRDELEHLLPHKIDTWLLDDETRDLRRYVEQGSVVAFDRGSAR